MGALDEPDEGAGSIEAEVVDLSVKEIGVQVEDRRLEPFLS